MSTPVTDDARADDPGMLRRVIGDVSVALVLGVVLGGTFLLEPKTTPPPLDEPNDEVVQTLAPPPPAPPALPSLPPPDSTPRVQLRNTPLGRFGLVTLTGNPDDPSDDNKKLTYSALGETNNTRVWVDGRTPIFGESEGLTIEAYHQEPDGSQVTVWEYRGVRVRQALRMIAGELSRRTDTIRVSYQLQNTSDTPHNVGLRMMLDSLIGDNDGVPFLVPGRGGIVTAPLALEGEAVPDFVQSLERGDLDRPGVVVDIGLTPAEGEERPAILKLTHWPGESAAWDYNESQAFGRDTAVGLYYPERPLAPGASRSMSFTYGLGTLSSTSSRNVSLSITTSGATRSGASFWLMVLVKNPKQGQAVALTLPAGLTPRKPASNRQTVASGGAYTQLSWLIDVAPATLGQVEVAATLEPGGITETQNLNVQPPDVQLTLLPRGPFRAGSSFWVSALVRNPRAGQSVTLVPADGLTLAKGHSPSQALATGDPTKSGGDFVQLNWLVSAGPRIEGRRTLTIRLAPDGVEVHKEIDVSPADLTH